MPKSSKLKRLFITSRRARKRRHNMAKSVNVIRGCCVTGYNPVGRLTSAVIAVQLSDSQPPMGHFDHGREGIVSEAARTTGAVFSPLQSSGTEAKRKHIVNDSSIQRSDMACYAPTHVFRWSFSKVADVRMKSWNQFGLTGGDQNMFHSISSASF